MRNWIYGRARHSVRAAMQNGVQMTARPTLARMFAFAGRARPRRHRTRADARSSVHTSATHEISAGSRHYFDTGESLHHCIKRCERP